MMGDQDDLYFEPVKDDYVIFIPAGKWHNLINTGHTPIKLYSIYTTNHPHGTIHVTKDDETHTVYLSDKKEKNKNLILFFFVI